jgi:hypothetical protein
MLDDLSARWPDKQVLPHRGKPEIVRELAAGIEPSHGLVGSPSVKLDAGQALRCHRRTIGSGWHRFNPPPASRSPLLGTCGEVLQESPTVEAAW